MRMYAPLDVTGNPIRNVPTPTAGTDGANKAYVDSKVPPATTGPTGYVASFINNTGNMGGFGGSSTATGIQLTAPLTAGRNYLISVNFVYTTTAANSNTFQIYDGTDSKQIASTPLLSASFLSLSATLLYAPTTTGVKTLRLDITRIAGTGNFTFNGAASYPIQLFVTDIGGTPPPAAGALGLVTSHILTTSQTLNVNPAVDNLTTTFTPVAGAAYRFSILSPFQKTDAASMWSSRINWAGGGVYLSTIPQGTSGEFSGTALYTAPSATPLTLTLTHDLSGASNNLTLPGAATQPRQLWVERIG